MKNIVVLGSTGSIGTQTLEIVEKNKDRFMVKGITANVNWELLASQARKLRPEIIAIGNPEAAVPLREALLDLEIEILTGKEGINRVAEMEADMAVIALVGISGLIPTLRAIDTGKVIALANKETLVVGGELVMSKSRQSGSFIVPIDSEHSAIFQCLNGENRKTIRKIILTSSGGPFRNLSIEELKTRKASDALKHPNWVMGKKVTIDSSTMMNKGLEIIEAHWLFDVTSEQIEVVIHPQSIIHSMVEFIDGSIMAQLSLPDMRIPIQYALSYPDRLPASFVNTDFIKLGSLTFEKPKISYFPCIQYAFEALKTGGTMPAVLNSANEVAVQLFLGDRIGFMDISAIIYGIMEKHNPVKSPSLEDLLEADEWARREASCYWRKLS